MAFLLPLLPAIISAVATIGSTVGGAMMNRKTAESQADAASAGTGSGAAAVGGPAGASAPGISPTDFRNQSTAQWQNLLGGLGQGVPGGGLPEGIQANIDRQASLLG